MKSTRALILLAVLSLVAMPACGLKSESGGLEFEQEISFGPGDFIYTDTRAGLSTLTSYTVSLTREFEGTHDGNPLKWTRTYTMLATNEPFGRQWIVEETAPQPAQLYLAEVDGVSYERADGADCSATEIEEGASLTDRLELAALLTGVIGAEDAGTDRVNEIAAEHYTFDERALGEDSLTDATGEIWVASEGGYIVRYLLTTTAGEEYFGEGIEGPLFTAYELTAPNQPVAIALPDDCPPGMVDAPLLPDASNVERGAGMLAYETETSITDATNFYAEQMPGLGWEPGGAPVVEENQAFLRFTQNGKLLGVIISVQEGVTTVRILISGQ